MKGGCRMSSHNPYQTNWHANYQGDYDWQSGYQSNDHAKMDGSGIYPNTLPVENTARGYDYYQQNSYHGTSPDMQYMNQMMTNLGCQLDKLNELITQNNQLLQSLHDQEDTKCVQGSGGGAVIVRM